MTDDSTGATLPPAARDRLAEIRGSGTWGSALSADEFAAIRGVGFEPVGQVLGACVYNIGYAGGYTCPGGWSSGVFGGVVTAAGTAEVERNTRAAQDDGDDFGVGGHTTGGGRRDGLEPTGLVL